MDCLNIIFWNLIPHSKEKHDTLKDILEGSLTRFQENDKFLQ